jgi:hypothetical protein
VQLLNMLNCKYAIKLHRISHPISQRLVVSESVYQSASACGLLSSPGSPLEDQQFSLDIIGFGFGTCNWKRSVSSRWPKIGRVRESKFCGKFSQDEFYKKNQTIG